MIDLNTSEIFNPKGKKSLGIYYVQGKVDSMLFKCLHGDDYTILIGDPKAIRKYLNLLQIEIIYEDIKFLNSMIPLYDVCNVDARIEPGAIIRESAIIEKGVIILMGAIVNMKAHIGYDTMIDMNAVIGSGAKIGARVHVGAGSVVAGMLEPACSLAVIIEDDVVIGANAVILEGVHIKKGAIIGAGSVVTRDVEENCVVAGVPATQIKYRSDVNQNIEINDVLRQ